MTPVQEENLKAIFGLKLRQYREAKKFSTQELAAKAGVSASYINEIEKGKKYPKADKIMSLATALEVDYDEMVSLKLGKQLGQLSDLLKSNAFQEMPLELFGIKTSDQLGYVILDLEERALTSSWINVESFDQVLNNFKASYFSGAILMNSYTLVRKLQAFFNKDTWNPDALLDMIDYFDTTPETFTHRLTQILPHYFGLDQLFFLRFHNEPGTQQFKLTKELHLSQLHNPHRVNPSEHYCRRWVTVSLLQDLADSDQHNAGEQPLVDIQRSQYYGTENEYICISFARPLALNSDTNSCITLGLMDNDTLRKNVNFIGNTDIKTRVVNESCERCPIPDCEERAAEPSISRLDQKKREREEALQQFLRKNSE